jgi:hypothetical protein
MTMRHADRSKGGKKDKDVPQTIVWFRSRKPESLDKWEGPIEVISGETNREYTDGHQCIPLENEKCMIIARTSAGHYMENGPKGAFYARVFNGSEWENQYKLDLSDGTGGSDRRFSATFDGKELVLHLVYTDGKKRLVYRTCKPPYSLSDWSESYYPVKVKCFTQCVGLDRSKKPACPVIVYGRQKKSDGGRLHSGELYLIRYDDMNWSKPILVSEKGRKDNWYPNTLRQHGMLCFLK